MELNKFWTGLYIGLFIGFFIGVFTTIFLYSTTLNTHQKQIAEMDIELSKFERYYEQATPVFTLLETVDSLVQTQVNLAYLPSSDTPWYKSTMVGMGGQHPDSSTIKDKLWQAKK